MHDFIAILFFFVAAYWFHLSYETTRDEGYTSTIALALGLIFTVLAVYLMARGARVRRGQPGDK